MSQEWTTAMPEIWYVLQRDAQLPADVIEITEERFYG